MCGCNVKGCKSVHYCSCVEKVVHGIPGPTGPTGPTGLGITISGTVTGVEDLPASAENGKAYFVGEEEPRKVFVFDEDKNMWIEQGYMQGEKGEKGDKGDIGPTGPTGPSEIKAVYVVTLKDPSLELNEFGMEIESGKRLPLKRLDISSTRDNLIQLNAEENTIQFNEIGTYEIIFTFNGNILSIEPFNIQTDFISVGFRAVDANEVYIGANDWSASEIPHNITGIGLLRVTDIATAYELVNLQKKSMYLVGGNKRETLTDSYFTTPMVTMIIKKLS